DFARDLRERGMDAWALNVENQMELTFSQFSSVEAAVPGGSDSKKPLKTTATTESEFSVFAQIGESIGAAPAKLEKIRVLAGYLRSLNSEQLPIATTYFTGRVFAQSDPRTLQVGPSIVYRAIKGAAYLSDEEFHRTAHRHGDASKTAFEALEDRTKPEPFTMA